MSFPSLLSLYLFKKHKLPNELFISIISFLSIPELANIGASLFDLELFYNINQYTPSIDINSEAYNGLDDAGLPSIPSSHMWFICPEPLFQLYMLKHLNLLQTILENKFQDYRLEYKNIVFLAYYNRLDLLKIVHSNNFIDIIENPSILDCAAEKGNLEIIKYLTEIGSSATEHAMTQAAKNNYLNVLDYLYKNRNEGCHQNTLDYACENGSLECVKYIVENDISTLNNSALDVASSNGHIKVVEYLHYRKFTCTTSAMNLASKNGHLDVVEFLDKNRSEGCTIDAMNYAAASNHLNVLIYLNENRCEGCSVFAMNKAAGNGHLEIVKYLHLNRSEGCTKEAMTMAAINGYIEVVEFLNFNRSEKCHGNAIVQAAYFGFENVVKFLILNNFSTMEDIKEARNRALFRGHTGCVYVLDKKLAGS